MSPFDTAWRLLKEFYIDDNDDSRGFFTTPGEDSEDALAHFRSIRSPFTRGGSYPRLQPDGSFVGARVGRDTDDSDESIQDLADTLAHEHVHNLIEGEMEDFATEKFGSPQLLAPVFGEPQPREQPSGRRRNPFQKRPILNQSEIDADKERLTLREQAKSYAHEYGAHQADQASQPGVNSYLAERPDTGDMYSQIRTDQFGYYPSMQEQQQVASMMPPPIQQPDTIQAGEPMNLAWRILKTRIDVERERNRPALRPTRKKPPGTFESEKKEKIDRLIEEERGMSLEEWRNKVLDDAYNRNFAFRSGGQSRLPGYIEHFATSSRQLGKPEIPKSALMPAIGDALRDVEQNRIADAAPARPEPKTQPARLHMGVSHNRGRDFFLQDEEGNPLATIEGMKRFVTPRPPNIARNIKGFSGTSQEQRRGHYRDLIESLLRHGFTLDSDSRNEMSNPFHRKFLRTLPDDIESPQEYQDLIGRFDTIEYEAHAPFSRTKDLDYGDLVVETRSKYPMTYDTPYQGYKRRLDEGIDPDQDIIVPAHIDREGNKIPQKQYFQSRLTNTGYDIDDDEITTREGIIVPKNLKSVSYLGPFLQTGGATIPEFHPDLEVLSASQPSAQRMMAFGIDPVTRMRQQVGVVDNGTQLRQAQLNDKLMSGYNLTTEELDEYGGQS